MSIISSNSASLNGGSSAAAAEGIEVDGHHLDGIVSQCGEALCVTGFQPGEQGRMDGGMECLHVPIEHLGVTGDLARIDDLETGIAQGTCCSTGRDEVEPRLNESFSERYDAGLVPR